MPNSTVWINLPRNCLSANQSCCTVNSALTHVLEVLLLHCRCCSDATAFVNKVSGLCLQAICSTMSMSLRVLQPVTVAQPDVVCDW